MSMDMEEQLVRDRKRKQFTGGPDANPRRAGPWIAGVIALALLVGIGAWYWGGGSSDEPRAAAAAPPTPTRAAVVADNGVFRVPLADLASGEAQFFEHKPATGLPVRFFAIKSSDGTHRVALDACEVCYDARKGYRQNGNEMLCRKCGLSFPSEVIDQTAGGCHPIAVPRTTEGNDLVVKAVDVETIDAKYAALAATPRRPSMPQRPPMAR